jgi:hypothetical protein
MSSSGIILLHGREEDAVDPPHLHADELADADEVVDVLDIALQPGGGIDDGSEMLHAARPFRLFAWRVLQGLPRRSE